jgi:predicted DCC family thiol-disulfide oxidoreductase YuxK
VPAPPGEDLHFEARWPLRLAQWLVVSVYLSAAVAKLSHGGLAWVNGYTLAYHFTNDGVRWHKTLPLLLAGMPHMLAALSILAVTLEATFVLAIVVPRLARLYVLGGALMHTSMWFIQRAPFFQYFFVYLVFIESLRRYWPLARAAARAAHAPRWTLVYDGLCPVCVRTMTVLDFLDGRRRLRFVDLAGDWTRVATVAPALTPEQASAAMHLLGSSGEVYRGFFAFRRLARELPPLWVLLPVLHLPGAGTIGPMVYDYVARNRSHAPCRAEVCTV